jgi:hypothetical protein
MTSATFAGGGGPAAASAASEVMLDALGRENAVARAHRVSGAAHAVRENALEAVDDLVDLDVVVRDGHPRARGTSTSNTSACPSLFSAEAKKVTTICPSRISSPAIGPIVSPQSVRLT